MSRRLFLLLQTTRRAHALGQLIRVPGAAGRPLPVQQVGPTSARTSWETAASRAGCPTPEAPPPASSANRGTCRRWGRGGRAENLGLKRLSRGRRPEARAPWTCKDCRAPVERGCAAVAATGQSAAEAREEGLPRDTGGRMGAIPGTRAPACPELPRLARDAPSPAGLGVRRVGGRLGEPRAALRPPGPRPVRGRSASGRRGCEPCSRRCVDTLRTRRALCGAWGGSPRPDPAGDVGVTGARPVL